MCHVLAGSPNQVPAFTLTHHISCYWTSFTSPVTVYTWLRYAENWKSGLRGSWPYHSRSEHAVFAILRTEDPISNQFQVAGHTLTIDLPHMQARSNGSQKGLRAQILQTRFDGVKEF